MAKQILVVDDDRAVRLFYYRVFTQIGYAVVTVASGEEGEIWFKDQEFSLLVTDFNLGTGINGIELANRCRLARPHVPIALVTSSDIGGPPPVSISRVFEKPITSQMLRSLTMLIL